MKANSKSKLTNDNTAYVKVVGGLVALLLMIIIGVMVYWETQGSIEGFGSVTEYITSDSDGNTFVLTTSNGTGELLELEYSINSVTTLTCYNSSNGSTYTLSTEGTNYNTNGKFLQIEAGQGDEFNQVNVTYVPNMGAGEDSTSDMASTIFSLLPIIALAVVAAIIIGLIIGFGGSSKRL